MARTLVLILLGASGVAALAGLVYAAGAAVALVLAAIAVPAALGWAAYFGAKAAARRGAAGRCVAPAP